jgi:hypothetical protein
VGVVPDGHLCVLAVSLLSWVEVHHSCLSDLCNTLSSKSKQMCAVMLSGRDTECVVLGGGCPKVGSVQLTLGWGSLGLL